MRMIEYVTDRIANDERWFIFGYPLFAASMLLAMTLALGMAAFVLFWGFQLLIEIKDAVPWPAFLEGVK